MSKIEDIIKKISSAHIENVNKHVESLVNEMNNSLDEEKIVIISDLALKLIKETLPSTNRSGLIIADKLLQLNYPKFFLKKLINALIVSFSIKQTKVKETSTALAKQLLNTLYEKNGNVDLFWKIFSKNLTSNVMCLRESTLDLFYFTVIKYDNFMFSQYINPIIINLNNGSTYSKRCAELIVEKLCHKFPDEVISVIKEQFPDNYKKVISKYMPGGINNKKVETFTDKADDKFITNYEIEEMIIKEFDDPLPDLKPSNRKIELAELAPLLSRKADWEKRKDTMSLVVELAKGCKNKKEFSGKLKNIIDGIMDCLLDARSILCKHTCLCWVSISKELGNTMDCFSELVIPKLLGRTCHGTKVIALSSELAVTHFARHCNGEKFKMILLQNYKNPSVTARLTVAKCLITAHETWDNVPQIINEMIVQMSGDQSDQIRSFIAKFNKTKAMNTDTFKSNKLFLSQEKEKSYHDFMKDRKSVNKEKTSVLVTPILIKPMKGYNPTPKDSSCSNFGHNKENISHENDTIKTPTYTSDKKVSLNSDIPLHSNFNSTSVKVKILKDDIFDSVNDYNFNELPKHEELDKSLIDDILVPCTKSESSTINEINDNINKESVFDSNHPPVINDECEIKKSSVIDDKIESIIEEETKMSKTSSHTNFSNECDTTPACDIHADPDDISPEKIVTSNITCPDNDVRSNVSSFTNDSPTCLANDMNSSNFNDLFSQLTSSLKLNNNADEIICMINNISEKHNLELKSNINELVSNLPSDKDVGLQVISSLKDIYQESVIVELCKTNVFYVNGYLIDYVSKSYEFNLKLSVSIILNVIRNGYLNHFKETIIDVVQKIDNLDTKESFVLLVSLCTLIPDLYRTDFFNALKTTLPKFYHLFNIQGVSNEEKITYDELNIIQKNIYKHNELDETTVLKALSSQNENIKLKALTLVRAFLMHSKDIICKVLNLVSSTNPRVSGSAILCMNSFINDSNFIDILYQIRDKIPDDIFLKVLMKVINLSKETLVKQLFNDHILDFIDKKLELNPDDFVIIELIILIATKIGVNILSSIPSLTEENRVYIVNNVVC